MSKFTEYLEQIQSVSKNGINKDHKFAMVQSGGFIGEFNKGGFIGNKKILFTSDNKEELDTKCQSWIKSRSPVEKSYYKLRYSVVPLNTSKLKEK